MRWEKMDSSTSILDVLIRNTGCTKEELFENKKYNFYNCFDKAKTIIDRYKNKQITVVGDYDCDGIMSSSIMKLGLEKYGCKNVIIRIPKRFSEGYGLSEKIIDEINEGLIITVDNGISSISAIKKAKDKGLSVIVTDHHLPSDTLPECDLLIDPHAVKGQADFEDYCGAGIAYKLFAYLMPKSTILYQLISLAAIATVADVMPLVGDNRKIVKLGLKTLTMQNGRTSGLYALMYRLSLTKGLDEHCIGFNIGPILNAPGRMFDDGARMSYELVSSNEPWAETIVKADKLISINTSRKQAVKDAWIRVSRMIEDECLFGSNIFVIYDPQCPEGIAGIVAGRIAENYQKPAIVFTDTTDPNVIKGSGRSNNIHLKNLLDKASSYIIKYGGHSGAAGLSIKKDNLYDFISFLDDNVNEIPTTESVLKYDLEIESDNVPEITKKLEKIGPFGEGNSPIIFKINNLKLLPNGGSGYVGILGEEKNILKISANGMSGIMFSTPQINSVKHYMSLGQPRCINCIGTIGYSYFNGKKEPQIEIKDFEAVHLKKEKSALQQLLEKKAAEINKTK